MHLLLSGYEKQNQINIVDSFFTHINTIGQIIASDSILTYTTSDRFYIRGFVELRVCSNDELDYMVQQCSNTDNDSGCRYVSCNYDYSSLKNASGFRVFYGVGISENYYNGDVFIGVMYNIHKNLTRNGVLEYIYSILERLGDNHFDPVMDGRI